MGAGCSGIRAIDKKCQKNLKHFLSLPSLNLDNPNGMGYLNEKAHARGIDLELVNAFGFQMDQIELQLLKKSEASVTANLWTQVSPQTFQTPYLELYRILALLEKRGCQSVVELGAAYGRMSWVAQVYFKLNYWGIEISFERVAEGNRILGEWLAVTGEFPRATLVTADLLELEGVQREQLMNADSFFLYDFADRKALAHVLNYLKGCKKGTFIIGRGRLTRDWIEQKEPWLSQVNKPEHHNTFTVYQV